MPQVVKLILQGILLIPPDECPDFIYKMMAATWKTDPEDRTNFNDILDAFIGNNPMCKQRLAAQTSRKGQPGTGCRTRGSADLPCLVEVDEEVLAAGVADCNAMPSQHQASVALALSSSCRRGDEQTADTYMVPLELEGVRVQQSASVSSE